MRYIGSKTKLSRREGVDLETKTFGSQSQQRLLKKVLNRPGQHGTRRRKTSEHGKQLRQKQLLKSMFGVTESQMVRYFAKAKKTLGNTALFLSQLLESRLDNVIFRTGFAPTRAAARQLVAHGHFTINGKKVYSPSYHIEPGMQIAFRKESSQKIPAISQSLDRTDLIVPAWIQKKENNTIVLQAIPDDSLITKIANLRLVIEFYSK